MSSFNQYGCTVSPSQFKTAEKRTFRLADLTRVNLSRSHAFLLVPVHLGIFSTIYGTADLLFPIEVFLGLAFIVVVGGLSFSIGVITVTGRHNLKGFAKAGWYWQMKEVKAALDSALERVERSGNRRRR